MNIKSSLKRQTIVEIIASLLILLFLYTAASKLISFQQFKEQMNNQAFPNFLKPYVIWSLPFIEIIVAIALMFPRTKKIGFWGSFILMSLFTIYIALALLNVFDKMPCSCGGVIANFTWKEHFFFNLLFLILAFWGMILSRSIERKEINISREPIFT